MYCQLKTYSNSANGKWWRKVLGYVELVNWMKELRLVVIVVWHCNFNLRLSFLYNMNGEIVKSLIMFKNL